MAKYDYLVAGTSIVNNVEYANGSKTTKKIGGSIYAVEGVRCYTESVLYISNAGPDFKEYFGKYMQDNNLSFEGVDDSCLKNTHYTTVHYRQGGTFYEDSIYENDSFMENLKTGHIRASQIEAFAEGVQGIYIDDHIDQPIWDDIFDLRDKYGFKIMWEIPTRATSDESVRDQLFFLVDQVDMFSVNKPESFDLFEVDNEQDAIERMLELDTPCFYRVGKKGSYMISSGDVAHAPCVTITEEIDPTGCGNSSTAAAMYSFFEGYDNLMVAVMANVASGYNIAQYGPFPKFTAEITKSAEKLAGEIYHDLKNK